MSRSDQSGFSVIEALVAVAVVAIALVPLIALQAQVSRDHIRQQAVRAGLAAQRNALVLLRDINLTAAPHGRRDLGGGQSIAWDARALTRTVRATDRGAGDGAFDVTLYRVRVTIDPGGGGEPSAFDVEQVGWRPVASVQQAPRGAQKAAPIATAPNPRGE